MMWLWWFDRSAGLVGYALLWLAVLTGILYNARSLGSLHLAARKLHVPASVMATVVFLLHAVVGTVDAWLVWSRRVPHPPYSDAYFAVGLAVGFVGLLLLVTAFLAFTDPRRFERPWDPRTVHLFAYGGFAFATVHAVAIGTDLYKVVRPGAVAATVLIIYALLLRHFANRAAAKAKARQTKAPGGASPGVAAATAALSRDSTAVKEAS